jgi:hypothetical protein
MKHVKYSNYWRNIALFSFMAVLSKPIYSFGVACETEVETSPLTKSAKALVKDVAKAVPASSKESAHHSGISASTSEKTSEFDHHSSTSASTLEKTSAHDHPASTTGKALAKASATASHGETPVKIPVLAHRFYVSPDEAREYDTRTLATLLIQRLHNECDLSSDPEPTEKPVSNDSELVMMANGRLMSSIAKWGFQNQHETASTGGCACTENRFNTEQEMIMSELPYSNKGKELLPKYSSFNVKRSDFGSFSLPTQYGDTAIIFKPEVKARSTWTYSDSLTTDTGHSELYQSGFKNGNLTHTDQYTRDKNDKNQCSNYCEAQIWGELDMTDVDSLLVAQASDITDDMKALGVPIYQRLTTSPTPSAAQYSKGPLLYTPPAGVKPIAPKALTEDELQKIVTPDPSGSPLPPPVRSIAGGKLLEFTPNEKLASPESIAAFTASTVSSGWGSLDTSSSGLAELAGRKKTPAIIAGLEEVFDKGTPVSKALALYGLSEAPWTEVKSRVITALTGTDQPLALLGIAIAADHQTDPDIVEALKKTATNFPSAPSGWGYGYGGGASAGAPPIVARNTVQEHIDRLTKKRFCDAPPAAPTTPASTTSTTTSKGGSL